VGLALPAKRTIGKSLSERLTENAYRRILPARYLRKDERGRVIETPEEMFRRVAENLAQPEGEYGHSVCQVADVFYRMMTDLEFMPNSPALMNAGAGLQQLAACFVLSPDDDLDSIFGTLAKAAKIMQSGGGVGYSFSRLRPQGSIVHSTGGKASGPVSFMQVFDQMCATLKQGGKRRGAQMGILRVDHPDVARFAVAKRTEGVLTNFNLSVAITDEFIDALKNDDTYALRDPQTHEAFVVTEETARYYSTAHANASPEVVGENLWRDHGATIPGLSRFRGQTELQAGDAMYLPARFVWELIVDGAWRNGEPGIFLVDLANRDHTFDVGVHPEHRIEATNPCGEQPLEDYEACVLGHVNLSLMVAEGAPQWPEFAAANEGPLDEVVSRFLAKGVDWERLRRAVHWGTRLLDNAVTMSAFPLREIQEKQGALRSVGLGIMGYAQMLIQMGVIYGSEESIEIARQIMGDINRETKLASHELALERGTFSAWDESKYAAPSEYAEWFRKHTGLDPNDWPQGLTLRNHRTTSIAPTGTTGMIANTSPGCEPLFNVAYFRDIGADIQGEDMLVEFDDYFLRVLAANGVNVQAIQKEAIERMRSGAFRGPRDLPIPEDIARIFVTAGEIAPEAHVRMQAALQEHVDSAISKTINLPETATREDVDRAFRLAMALGCKGLTVYRTGSRRRQVIRTRGEKARARASHLICPECATPEGAL